MKKEAAEEVTPTTPPRSLGSSWRDWDKSSKIVGMLNLLREEEGAYVTVLCPNPDSDPVQDEAFPLPDPADRFLGAMVSLSAFGVPDSDILSALIGSAATSLGLILEEDPGFLGRMRENRPPLESALAVDQVLDGLAEIHRRNAEKMAADAAAPR